MDNGEIKGPLGTIIINGGNPLPGCPKDWDEAHKIEAKLNEGIDIYDSGTPNWRFDCGFKLDFDGPLLSVNSRFYPPTERGGSKWDGKVHISSMWEDLTVKEFECETLEQLKIEVDAYVNRITEKVNNLLTKIKHDE